MSLVDLNPAGLNLASLKPAFEAQAERQAAQTQQQVAQVQLTNAQDEQQRNNAFRASMALAAKSPSVEAYTAMLAQAPREYVEGLKASIAQMDAAQRKTLEAQIMPAWAAGSNNRPELLKAELKKLESGYESRGMTGKAAGIRELMEKYGDEPDIITTRLGSTLLEAVGPERMKVLMESASMGRKRRKEEQESDPEMHLAKLREQRAKAENEFQKAKNAETREKARSDAQVLDAQIKATENKYKERDTLATIGSKDASAYQSTQIGDRTKQATEREALTFGADVQKADDEARSAAAKATTDEAAATPKAVAAKAEQEAAQTRKFKAEAEAADAAAKALPAHIGDVVREGSKAARESMAAAVRARTAADGYRRIAASGAGTGTTERLKSWARGVAGTQDKRDDLNQLASRILNSEVIELAQKIRPVSDTDMKILRQGLPDTWGNPKLVVDFMDALSRVQEKQALLQIDSVAWEAKFRGPNDAGKDTSINGVNVKAGESYDSFLRRAGHVRDALSYIRDPKTPPEKRADALARLRAAGENVDGR